MEYRLYLIRKKSGIRTAANFVTGVSTNGLIAWKDIEGNTLKSLLSEEA